MLARKKRGIESVRRVRGPRKESVRLGMVVYTGG